MLQQTQTNRVLPKYAAWLRRFPDFKTLAAASSGEVLAAWQGLGYNRRALALQKTARLVIAEHRGKLPRMPEELVALPGIGDYTAGAILAFAFEKPAAFIETNIRRAFIHHFFPNKRVVHDRDLLPLIAASLPQRRPREWYYALMDYGAMLGRKMRAGNPNRRSSAYAKQGRFEGSRRQLRGKVLAALLRRKSVRMTELAALVGCGPEATRDTVRTLEQEGFLCVTRGRVSVAG